ncbi:MAG: thiamine phosphate synthase [Deltaproteobacteria bacterium]|nr:thiamine phosphate synthase [Deltaproteobacteria bacterium]
MRIHGLYAIVDSSTNAGVPLDQLSEDYVRGGARIVQWRDKKRKESSTSEKKFREIATEISSLKKDYDFLFIVNDDLEVALEVMADGIHVGKDDSSIPECRKILGPSKLIGYSSHSLEEALEAEKQGADYVAFGAIFPTATKGPGHPVQGIEKLRQVVQALKVPVVAIGGIGRHNIQDVLATGVASVAMISALAKADTHQERINEVQYLADRIIYENNFNHRRL